MPGLTLWQRFRDIADRFPDRPAVVEESATLDYRELAAAADRVAAAIATRTLDRPGPVGIIFDAGALAFAAMLGTLKLGRVYLPLDPGYPAARLRYMFEDCGAAVLITSECHRGQARAQGIDEHKTLYIEDIFRDADPHTGQAVGGCDEAMLLYTSGSTGNPKGFTQTHRNLLHDVMHYTNTAHFCAADRFLLVMPRTDTERRIAGLWSEVLGIATIGMNDRFLEPGGNSLLAMQIISSVLDQTGTTLSMKDVLLEASTVAEMSAIIDA